MKLNYVSWNQYIKIEKTMYFQKNIFRIIKYKHRNTFSYVILNIIIVFV